MAQYKVPQDIETEDKIVGFLSLKQLIFAIFFFGTGWFAWSLFQVQPLMAIPLVPFLVVFGILAFVQRKDQPVEVYLASLLRFFLVPRVKMWDQDGLTETVKIIAPKKEEKIYTDGRSREQVSGQLKNLARNIDTRGWAARDNNPGNPVSQFPSSDRLISIRELPQVKQIADIHSVDDPYEDDSPVGSHFESLMNVQHDQIRQEAQQRMRERAAAASSAPDTPADNTQSAVTADEATAVTQVDHGQQSSTKDDYSQDISENKKTEEPAPAILSLSSNDELPVSEIERQAKKVEEELEGEISEGEGIIALH